MKALQKSVEHFFSLTLIALLLFTFNFLRAVGCIFGELLNNSPLFPVSRESFHATYSAFFPGEKKAATHRLRLHSFSIFFFVAICSKQYRLQI